ENQSSSQVPDLHRSLCLRKYLYHPQHAEPHQCRYLLGVSPVLHWQAEVRGHGRSGGEVQQEVRRDLQLPEEPRLRRGSARWRWCEEVTVRASPLDMFNDSRRRPDEPPSTNPGGGSFDSPERARSVIPSFLAALGMTVLAIGMMGCGSKS